MQQVLSKYSDIIYALLTAVDVVSAALIVDSLNRSAYLPLGLIFTIVLAASLVTHYLLYRSASAVGKRSVTDVIGNVLQIAAQSLVFPENWDTETVRAYCHRLDRKGRTLHYVTSRASHSFDDQFTDIPVDAMDPAGRPIFVIAEAVRRGGTVFRELPETRTPEEEAANIWPGIRYVLASPVHRAQMAKTESNCLGVVSFDTDLDGGAKIDLNGGRARDMLMQVAQTVSLLWS
jgi:hypothetical protein